MLYGSVVSESFHRGLTHVEAITGEMSRMCQELLALWCLGTTYTSDLEPRDRKAPQRSKQQAEFSNRTCWPGFWTIDKAFLHAYLNFEQINQLLEQSEYVK